MEQRAEDVLRHLHAMRAARAGQRDRGRQIRQRQPAFDARRQRLDPAQPRIRASIPAGAPKAKIASPPPGIGRGSALPGTASTCTSPARPASEMAVR